MKDIIFVSPFRYFNPTTRRAVYYYENMNKIYDCDIFLPEKINSYNYMPLLGFFYARKFSVFRNGVGPLCPKSKIVHIFEPYITNSFILFLNKILKGAKIILDISDLNSAALTYKDLQLPLLKLMEKSVPFLSDKVIVASHALKDMHTKRVTKKENIIYLPIGVDIERFNGAQKMNIKKSEKPVIMWIGALWEKADLEPLFKALQKIDADCYIIGDGQARQYFGNLASEMRVSDKVVFYGWVDFEQIPSFLKSADILCLPMEDNLFNRYRFPTKLCEYLVSGTPVVVSNVGEVRHVLNENHAFLVERLDDLANVINYALANPELARQKAENAKKLVIEKFDKRFQIEALKKIYNELLKF